MMLRSRKAGIRCEGHSVLILRHDEAYVLRTQELGESDLIVSLFTREHGTLRGVARAARKSRRRYGGALEPLTLVRLGWAEKQGRELHRIEALDCVRSFATMQSDPVTQAACAVLSEVTESLGREGQSESRAFQLLGAVLAALEQGCPAWVAVRYFEFWMLRIHGLLAELDACAGCGARLPHDRAARVDRHGILRCSRCASSSGGRQHRFGERERAFLEQARSCPPAQVSCNAEAVAPGQGLEAALRGTLESFVERRFRTYRHLAAVAARPERGTSRQ